MPINKDSMTLGGGVFSSPQIGQVVDVDANTMTASAIISTPAVDRVGDSMDPLGCDLSQYKLNPVVFWNHAFDGFTKPIGISEHKETGKLEVYPTSENIKAVCHFTDKFLEAEQIFELVNEKTIRATSIRFDPIGSPSRANGVQRFSKWYLLEWSWVPIGCNPEAVQEVLAKGYLAGRRISSGITKSLQLVVPERKLALPGFNPKRDQKMRFAKSCDENKCNCEEGDSLGGKVKMQDEEQKKPADAAAPGSKPYGASSGVQSAPPSTPQYQSSPQTPETGAQSPDMAKSGAGEGSNGEDMEGGEESPKPYGAQLVEAAYNALNEVRVNISEGAVTLENPEIEALIASTLEALSMMMGKVEEAYEKAYVRNAKYNYTPLAATGRRLDWHDTLKSFLGASARNRFAASGIAERIKSVVQSGTIPGRQAEILKSCASQLQGFVEQARTDVRSESDGVVGERLESITKASQATLDFLKAFKR